MKEVLIISHLDGHKSIKYESSDSLGHELIDYYTIKTLTEEQLEEIKTATVDKLQIILNYYI